jgi:hypothetical protein
MMAAISRQGEQLAELTAIVRGGVHVPPGDHTRIEDVTFP